MKALLVNASAPGYNLGLEKAANWWHAQGAAVEFAREVPTLFLESYDAVWISAIFSWHVPGLISMAQRALDAGKRVEVGGPGTFGAREHIRQKTGLTAQARPDPRFEQQPGFYRMVFWSRGCPATHCSLGFPREGETPVCSVPQIEGRHFTLYKDVTPAPVILDNNLSGLPRRHQELIVERTLSARFPRVDCNSGFEPRSIRPWTVELWRELPLVAWRYAYDELGERAAVIRTLEILDAAGIARRRSRIYCLAGNEPLEACEQRVRDIVSWGCLPIVQRRRPLDWLGGPLPTLHDWTEQRLIDFQRWGNRLAKGVAFAEYRRGFKEQHADGAMFKEKNQ